MRWLVTAALAVAMLAFGMGVHHAAGMLRAKGDAVERPTDVTARALPGTVYLVQGGAIYRFHSGRFSQITSDDGWAQVAVNPDGSELAAVERHEDYSDIYLLSTSGRVMARLTDNGPGRLPENDHWAFYPRFSPDGSTLYYAYDLKDPYSSYEVDLAIYASPADPSSSASVRWSQPNPYTGGDVDPQPLRSGGIVFARYSIDTSFQVISQLWLQASARSQGAALTDARAGCGSPAVSPDGTHVAMVCTHGSGQSAELDVAAFDASSGDLGAMTPLAAGQMIASPAFSPDGKTIAYLAPATPGDAFQLWTVDAAPGSAPREITTRLGIDSTSAPAWTASG